MLVRPSDLAFGEFLAVCREGRRVGDLSDQICGRCLCNPVDENTQQRDLEKDVKSYSKTKEEPFTVTEP